MNILCIFAGQGYQEDNLFTFFNEDQASQTILQHHLTAMNLLDNKSQSIKDPFYTQLIIGGYQMTLFNRIKSFFKGHQLNFAGYSLGEVAAFLASIEASPEEINRVLAYRTQLMTSLIKKHCESDYDLLYINGAFNLEEVSALCADQHCYLAIINSEKQLVVGGKVTDLKRLINRLSDAHLKKAQFLEIHLPSHTPLYKNQQGLFHHFLNTLAAENLLYPIINPIKLGKVYELEEEKELLDKEIYSPLQWQKICELINEYQYDLIIDLGPGEAMTHFLDNKRSRVITASRFKKIAGFCKVVSSACNQDAMARGG
ncbi:acyltransferase domain-containing protein [Tatlockia micdadei]|uniref:acyltransferase domain-containing protein n=1 Tax=Legionella micdadei TaxID=451 RepID=UPI001570BF40|nr:acyltransferase domain-containing protein [Legionella micdadei]